MSITVITGPMFASKTSGLLEFVRRYRRRGAVLVVRPPADDRAEGEDVVTHNGERFPAVVAHDVLAAASTGLVAVGVDEGQFFGEDLVTACRTLRLRGVHVCVSALNLDWRGEPFAVVAELEAHADFVNRKLAVCDECGADAVYSQRLVASSERKLTGGADKYSARCFRCFVPPNDRS